MLGPLRIVREEDESVEKEVTFSSGRYKIKHARRKIDPNDEDEKIPKHAVELESLKRGQCCWPYGNNKIGVKFCGKSVEPGKSYCLYHSNRAVRKGGSIE